MQIAVVYSPRTRAFGASLCERLRTQGLPLLALEVDMHTRQDSRPAIWQHQTFEEHAGSLADIGHIVAIALPDELSSEWVSFCAGLSLGRECEMSLLVPESGGTDGEHSPYPRGAPGSVCVYSSVGKTAECVQAQFSAAQRKAATKQARDELVERGHAVTGDAFAEAVAAGDSEAVELFLRAGFSADTCNTRGTPVIALAARSGHEEIVRALIEDGVDVNQVTADRGNSALMEAAGKGRIEMVRMLLDAGAETDIVSKNGQTALMLSVTEGQRQTAAELLERGADPGISDSLGMTAIKYAKLYGYQSIISYVCGGNDQS